jgi:PAS domain S-box-containing protein
VATTSTGVAAVGFEPVFRTAFERSSNAMLMADFDRRILAANEASAVLAGRSAEWLIGQRVTALLEDPAAAPDDAAWRAQVLAGESFGRRTIRRPDNSTRIVDFAMQPTRVDGRVLVLGVCIHERSRPELDRPHAPAALTARERDIVHRIALGDVSADICAELHIAPDTVRAHVRNAMAKTGARTRAQLIAIALSNGLLDP